MLIDDLQIASFGFSSGKTGKHCPRRTLKKLGPTPKLSVVLIDEMKHVARQCDRCLDFHTTIILPELIMSTQDILQHSAIRGSGNTVIDDLVVIETLAPASRASLVARPKTIPKSLSPPNA